MTVQEMLQHYPFSESRVLAGHLGLGREVESINVVDAPDIVDWVKPFELLLTSAYALKDVVDGPELIQLLAKKKVAGLAIKIGRFLHAIPEDLQAAAEAQAFPILGLPLHFSLSDHLTHMYSLILHKEHLPVRHEVESVLLKQVGIDSLLGSSLPLAEWMGQLKREVNRELRFYSCSNELSALKPFVPLGDDFGCPSPLGLVSGINTEGHRVWRHPVAYAGVFYGWLHMYEDDRPFFAEEELLLRHAATVLGWRAHEETTKIGLVLVDALHKTPQSCSWSESLAGQGFTFPLPFYCAVISTQPQSSLGVQAKMRKPLVSRQRKEQVVSEVLQRLRTDRDLGMLGASHWPIGDDVFSIVGEGDVLRYLPAVLQDLMRQTGQPLWIGLSELHNTVCEWPHAFHEAWSRLKTGLAQSASGGVFHQDRHTFWMLWQDMDRSKMETFRDRVLGPIIASPAYEQLLDTLRAYFACDGKLDLAAQRLYVHRNTLAYRLKRIEELLHRHLKNPDDAVDIRLALSITEIL